MSDLVDRYAAINAVNNAVAEYIPTLHGRFVAIPYKVAHAIMKLPSVEPKTGKWAVTPVCITCSECGESFPLIPQNYCPNCGAKMEVEHAELD